MAQLVARLVRNEKVRGSNPLSSTTTKALPLGRAFVVRPDDVAVAPAASLRWSSLHRGGPPIVLSTILVGARVLTVQRLHSMPCSVA